MLCLTANLLWEAKCPCLPLVVCSRLYTQCVCEGGGGRGEFSLQTSFVSVPLHCVAGCKLKATRSIDTSTQILCTIFTRMKACGTNHRQGQQRSVLCARAQVCVLWKMWFVTAAHQYICHLDFHLVLLYKSCNLTVLCLTSNGACSNGRAVATTCYIYTTLASRTSRGRRGAVSRLPV